MAEVDTITVLDSQGVEREVPTLLSVEEILGAAADAASATTTIKAALRAIATALGVTALDLGSGTGGTRTLRTFLDPASQNANGQATMANSAPTTFASDQSTLSIAPDTSRILNGASGVSLTPKWAFVDATASGDTSVVALVSGKKIRVLFWEMSPEAAVNARFRSNTTSKTALYYMDGKGNGQRAGFNQAGWFETASGEALNVNLSGAINVGVLVGYVEV